MTDTAVPTTDPIGSSIGRAVRNPSIGRTLRSTPPATLAAAVATVVVAVIAGRFVPVAAVVGVITMVPAGLVDLHERRLPNRLVLTAATATMLAIAAGVASGSHLRISDGLTGSAIMAGPLLVMHLVSPTAMGFGDVKAALVLGGALGLVHPHLPLVALLIGSACTAAAGIATRRSMMPFGPGLVAASAVTLALSGPAIGLLDGGSSGPAQTLGTVIGSEE